VEQVAAWTPPPAELDPDVGDVVDSEKPPADPGRSNFRRLTGGSPDGRRRLFHYAR
jgi:hypothetical protein